MIEIFDKVLGIHQANHMHEFDLDALQNMPYMIYSKDNQGKYIACNRYIARHTGFENINDMLGATDFDLPTLTKQQANKLHDNDNVVLKNKKPVYFLENISLVNQKKVIGISYKKPMTSHTNNILQQLK